MKPTKQLLTLMLALLLLSSCTKNYFVIIMQPTHSKQPQIHQPQPQINSNNFERDIINPSQLYKLEYRLDSLIREAHKQFPPLNINLDSIFIKPINL